MGIVGRVHHAGRNVGGVASDEDPIFSADPLFSTSSDNINNFFAMGVLVKRVRVKRIHCRANQQKLIGGH